MDARRLSRWLFWATASLAACDQRSAAPQVASAALSGNAVARVTGEGAPPISISGSTVVAIARAQHISLAEARERAISDALFSLEAQKKKRDITCASSIDGVLARRLAEGFLSEARELGPVTDEEVEAITQKHWYEVARPESFMTVHAVVMVKEGASADTVKRAEALANVLREAVLPLAAEAKKGPEPPLPTNERTPSDSMTAQFKAALANIPNDGFEVRVEQLPPVARDNLSVLPSGRGGIALEFVAAATALKVRGDVSPIVRSPFGFHVLMLLARYPGQELDLTARRARFLPEIYDVRARARVEDLLKRLHQETPADLARNLDAQLAEVQVRDARDVIPAGGARPVVESPAPGKSSSVAPVPSQE